MSSQTKLDEDVFVVPRENDQYYLYVPLRRLVAVVNGAAVKVVAKFLEDGPSTLSPSMAAVIEQLLARGFFEQQIPSAPTVPNDYVFCPHEVTLFPTSKCNLRCRYCYADAGKKNLQMPWEVARAAIDLVATNAGLLGSKKFAVGFHGGGEPTVTWNLIVKCVDHARKKADDTGLDVEIFAATNALLSRRQREYIAKYFTTVNVSLDGPQDIQDFNRPKTDGSGSYREVKETLEYFDKVGFFYGVRATITSASVGRMEEIVEQLRSKFNLAYLHLEPVWMCGRLSRDSKLVR